MKVAALALLLAACADRVPSSVPYQPVNYSAGQELVEAYDCKGVSAGTKLVFAGMQGTDVQAWTPDAAMVTLDRRCVEASA